MPGMFHIIPCWKLLLRKLDHLGATRFADQLGSDFRLVEDQDRDGHSKGGMYDHKRGLSIQ